MVSGALELALWKTISVGQMVPPRSIQNVDFWKNPWDVGGLTVIGLFTSTFLLFILFAVVFGYVEKAVFEEE
ncbi:small integral membrane protein 6 [Mus caroli]|uniref:Small integral membrane protein 6 n=1 Tax=Mus caroli TaxID=10089 RepID=A0A6P5QKH7_MUSCR|nr:small integral membrane protein 6 [Mus caroli]